MERLLFRHTAEGDGDRGASMAANGSSTPLVLSNLAQHVLRASAHSFSRALADSCH